MKITYEFADGTKMKWRWMSIPMVGQRQENKRYEKYDRDRAVHRRYGHAWKRIRDRHMFKASKIL